MSNIPDDVVATCAEALGSFPILTVEARQKILLRCLVKKRLGEKSWAAVVSRTISKESPLSFVASQCFAAFNYYTYTYGLVFLIP